MKKEIKRTRIQKNGENEQGDVMENKSDFNTAWEKATEVGSNLSKIIEVVTSKAKGEDVFEDTPKEWMSYSEHLCNLKVLITKKFFMCDTCLDVAPCNIIVCGLQVWPKLTLLEGWESNIMEFGEVRVVGKLDGIPVLSSKKVEPFGIFMAFIFAGRMFHSTKIQLVENKSNQEDQKVVDKKV